MRKIEKQMLQAIHSKADKWTCDNTAVFLDGIGNPYGPRSEVYLHGNMIAAYWHGPNVPENERLEVDIRTLARWPSNTTKSRLRALGANVATKAGKTYLDGVLV
jgi:CobQ-like glutamine amidotransferase family enzyme